MNTLYTPPLHLRWYALMCFLFLSFLLPGTAQSHGISQDFWKSTDFPSDLEVERTSPLPFVFSSYSLHFDNLKSTLTQAPSRFTTDESDVVLSIPMRDGSLLSFEVYQAPVFAELLAKKYENLSSYYIKNTDNQGISGRLDITTRGAYIFISHPEQGDFYIEPYTGHSNNFYIQYSAKDHGTPEQHAEFSCDVNPEIPEIKNTEAAEKSLLDDCLLRQYTLTVSATGEYTQWHGGTVADAMEKIMVLVSHTNFMFERDLGITFVLANNNDLLVFSDPLTDPFTNENKSLLLAENQEANNTYIGAGGYDLGIIVGIFGGGVALFNSVCNAQKAQASAGSTWSPEGYPLETTFIHELGHKFGASHSFNNFCNARTNATAFETGSGASIMSYAGACSPSVTYPRGYYFHGATINQVQQNLENGNAVACAFLINTNTNTPEVYAGENKTLPINTPFELRGTASDNPEALYSWEQIDIDITVAPPLPDNIAGPAFRSYTHQTSNVRSFPKIECILNTTSSTDCEWEVLPTVERTMNFRYTMFEQHNGHSCTVGDNLGLSFVQTASAFGVNYPNGGESLESAQSATIAWNTGDTELQPIAAPNVDIYLSVDGGYTYPWLLAEGVPNTGTAQVELPAVSSEKCRVKVKGNNHYFFDLSDADFRISEDGAFTLNPIESTLEFCGDFPPAVSFAIEVNSPTGAVVPVDFPASDNDGTGTISFSPNAVMTPAMVTATISGNWIEEEQVFSITAVSGAESDNLNLMIRRFDDTPSSPQIIAPAADSYAIDLATQLSWTSTAGANTYQVQVSTIPDFSSPLIDTETSDAILQLTNLSPLQTYYWHVKAKNSCGESNWSDISAFQTQNRQCTTYNAVNLPREIEDDDYSDAFVRVEVPDDFTVSELRVAEISVEHSHVGDLSGNLISPQGNIFKLFYRPGATENNPYGCDQNDLNLSFADGANATNEDLRQTCLPAPQTAISGQFQSLDPLSAYIGQSPYGQWLFNINDLSPTDGGLFLDAALEICRDDIQPAYDFTLSSSVLELEQSASEAIGTINFTSSHPVSTYQVVSLPAYGTLSLNNSAVSVGQTFTNTDLQTGVFSYQHDGSVSFDDSFLFDAVRTDGVWSGLKTFEISIIFSAPVAVASVAQEISCHDEADGQINTQANFGLPPYSYSLDGENFQDASEFTGLPAGTYTVFVKDALDIVTQSASLTLSNPTALTASTSVNFQTINVNAEGGTGTLSYSTDGSNFQTHNALVVNQDGIYTVSVKDENDCIITTEVVVNNLTVSADLTQDLACHDEANAVIVLSTENGIAPFSYRLNPNDEFQSSNTFNNLAAGTFNPEVRDALGNILATQSIEITNPTEIQTSVTTSGYTIIVDADNGQTGLLYSFNGGDFSEVSTFQGAPESNNSIVVQNAEGCTIELTADIDISPPAIESTTAQDILCAGEANGSLTVTATEGLAPYQYRINNGEWQDNPLFENLSQGTYDIEIRDAGGWLSEVFTEQIEMPSAIQINGQSNNGTLIIYAQGGTENFVYSIDGDNFQISNEFPDTDPGVYTLMVRDENDCEEASEYTHTIDDFNAGTSSNTLNPCAPDEPLTIDLCLNGGVPPYEVTTTPPAQNITESETADCEILYTLEFFGDLPSSIQVTSTDFIGTQFTNIVNVSTAQELSISTNVNDNNITVVALTGTPPYSFSLNGEDFQESGYFPELPNGSYTVYALDANGCETSTDILIDYSNTVIIPETDLYVYPNPAQDLVNIESDLFLSEDFEIILFDAVGRKLISQGIEGDSSLVQLEVGNLPVGFYEMLISGKEKAAYRKLVIVE